MSGRQLCVKQWKKKEEKRQEKHESAAAGVPGSGFNGLPQQRRTVAENWTACPRQLSARTGPGARHAQVRQNNVCVCRWKIAL